MASLLKEIRSLLCVHFIVNIILSLSYFVLKTMPPICGRLFETCELQLKEWEWLTFLGCVVVLKNRKQASTPQYVSTACMFAKILNMILYVKQNPVYAIIYAVLCLLHIVFLPAPVYEGPEHITYFRGTEEDFKNELMRDKRTTWLVAFYAAWSPSCVTFASIFSELSGKFAMDNLKFAKVDVTRYGPVAKGQGIDASSWSKQLPTLIMYEDGVETIRRPFVDSKNRIHKYMFCEETIATDFDLNGVQKKCKAALAKRKDAKHKEKTS